jgi:hypothetical protein
MELDFGDVRLNIELCVPGLQRYRVRRHYGAPRKRTAAAKGQSRPNTYSRDVRPTEGMVIMDLAADMELDVRTAWTDEVGNPAPTPGDASVTWSTDNPAVLDVVDNGDGTAVVGATGVLGSAHVRVEATTAGRTVTGEEEINVVAGLAERVAIELGEPRERTPDDEPVPADPPA